MQSEVDQAISILVSLGLSRAQQNERSALCLLPLLGLQPNEDWGITAREAKHVVLMLSQGSPIMHPMADQPDTGRGTTRATIGVEPFDTGYGGGFQVQIDSPDAMACELVEDDGVFCGHRPAAAQRPRRLAFVDGTMRVEARLTRTDERGTVTGMAGSWGAGAVLVAGERPLRFDQVTVGRAAIFTAGQRVELPPQPGGWRWEADSITGTELEAARDRLRRRMRDTEAAIAEDLSAQDWLTVIDGPLHNIRRTRTLPVIGYVKTHHRPMLAAAAWNQVPRLSAGERSGLFAMRDDLYGCYLRVGPPGPWAGPWAGIVRLEVPAGVGRALAMETADAAASWLPAFASALHRDARAPVNMAPVAGLERHLHHLQGDPRLALRAVRAAVLGLNRAATGAL